MQILSDMSLSVSRPCVATIGFFDGVHAGHDYLIQQVKEIAVAKSLRSALVTFPIHPRKVMNATYRPALLTTPEEKVALLAATGVEDCLLLDFTPELAKLSAREFMQEVLKRRFQVKCLVIGYDHRFGHNRQESFEDYARYGAEMDIEVVRAKAFTDSISLVDGEKVTVSSSIIRRLLLEGKVEAASCGLKYHYFLNGTVVGGYQVGRKIGYPTANLRVDNEEKLIPADGVYAVWVIVEGRRWMGMLNIGVRPTIGNGYQRSVEVHILHYEGDLYNQPIRVIFVKRIRAELKFDTIDQLVAQLHHDAEEIACFLQCENQSFQEDVYGTSVECRKE